MKLETFTFESLKMIPYQAGPIDNNTYLLADTETKTCVVIDPSYGFEEALETIQQEGWQIQAFWLTHAHYDHTIHAFYAGQVTPSIPIALHPDDLPIWEAGGTARLDQKEKEPSYPKPSIALADGMSLQTGRYSLTVLHTPGHSPGGCCFYLQEAGWLFSGDTVFYESFGRTDLYGGSMEVELRSIQNKVLTLPDETIIFPGHNDFTTVQRERHFYAANFGLH